MLRNATALAARLQASAEDDDTRVANAYRLLYSREPSDGELTSS